MRQTDAGYAYKLSRFHMTRQMLRFLVEIGREIPDSDHLTTYVNLAFNCGIENKVRVFV